MSSARDVLTAKSTMRDIHDYCVQNDKFSLAQGMIEIAPPKVLVDLIHELIADPTKNEVIHTYRKRYGEEDYLNSIQFILEKRFGVKVTTKQLLATAGVTGGIVSSFSHLSRLQHPATGKARLGLVEPFYTYHLKQSSLFYPKDDIVFIKPNSDLSINLENVRKSIHDEHLTTILVTNPGNPSGLVLSKDTLTQLVAICEEAKCYLILDEVYSDFVWNEDGKMYSPIQEETISEYVIAVRGFSKSLGLQSWRVGFLVSTQKNVDAIMANHDPLFISLNWMQHVLAQYFTEHYDDYVNHINTVGKLMRSNWTKLVAVLEKKMGWKAIEPEGSMYGCFHHNGTSDMEEVLSALDAGVGVAPGIIFYGTESNNTGFIRIHCGLSAEKVDKLVASLQ